MSEGSSQSTEGVSARKRLFTSGRASLPVRGTQTTRAQFHNLPVEVPPPRSIPAHIAEHAYT